MEGAALDAGAGGVNHRQLAAAQLHSKLLMADGARNMQIMPRKLLQQPNTFILEDADDALFLAIAICGGIGLLILFTFGIMWCIYSSKRRTRVPSADGSDSSGTEQDETVNGDAKLAAEFRRSEAQRSIGYGSERKLAMSAQLYHYEKQKRELLALEQGNQNEVEQSPHGTPPPAYSSFMNSQKSRDAAREEASNGKSSGNNAPKSLPIRENSGPNEEEEFAVYEYPGLVTTVGQIEIDNPLFRAPNPHGSDLADANGSRTGMMDATADADSASLFGAVQIVRQQPDLLASVDDESAQSSSSTKKSKRRGKLRETPSPSGASVSTSSTSTSRSVDRE